MFFISVRSSAECYYTSQINRKVANCICQNICADRLSGSYATNYMRVISLCNSHWLCTCIDSVSLISQGVIDEISLAFVF